MTTMLVRFWGVRGSIPSPGAGTVRYGGNTACVGVELPGGHTLVLDAGTGIRELGKALAGSGGPLAVLLSHVHWDHIQGFPFFAPLYQPGRPIRLFPATAAGRAQPMMCSLIEQMDGAHFPVRAEQLPSCLHVETAAPAQALRWEGVAVSRVALNHPGGGWGFRLERDGHAVVYLTDNELDPPHQPQTTWDQFVAFCRGADLLIHDAQYVDEDLPGKHGWGHSLVRQACDLAAAAQVRRLVLFHHDPDRTDAQVDAIQAAARCRLRDAGHAVACTAAFEGLVLAL